MAIAFTTVAGLVLLRMNRRLCFSLYRKTSILFTFICPVLLTFLLGGYEGSSLVIIWSLLCPLLGLLLDEPRTALNWFGLFLGANLLSLWAEDALLSEAPIPRAWGNGLEAVHVMGVGTILFLGLRYFFNQRQLAMEKLDRFAAVVAHELRNPMTTIALGVRHVLRESDDLKPSQRQALQVASAEAERCKRLLSDLLDLSRSKTERLQLSLQQTDLKQVLVAVARKAHQCLDATVTIACPLSPGQGLALVDPDHLEQVIFNLVENSCKYAERYQPIELSMAAGPQPDQLTISVADHGKPLSGSELAKIFSPFFRGSNAQGKTGSGLGLYVVRSIIETMHGTVSATARQGGGLVVAVTLPRTDA
ncbi:MAG: HAMP domain-containing sensor histidine kinase [Cyanobacteria bacterium]|nr:HAMP domain-containing sensor histidine kinase [Cyanobacteriota bacterium]